MTERTLTPLEIFIALIEPFESKRYVRLYLLADILRREYNLHGKKLLQFSQYINAMKCDPELEDYEVEGIVWLVDRRNTRGGKKAARSKKRRSSK